MSTTEIIETPPTASVEKSPDRIFKYCKIATFVLLGLLILGVVIFLILYFVVPKPADQSAISTVVLSVSTIGSTTVTKLATTTKPLYGSSTVVTTVTGEHLTTPKPLAFNKPIPNTAAPESFAISSSSF